MYEIWSLGHKPYEALDPSKVRDTPTDMPTSNLIFVGIIFLEVPVRTVHTNTIGSTVLCCYNQVVVVTSTFCSETSETAPNMCVVVERVKLHQVTL